MVLEDRAAPRREELAQEPLLSAIPQLGSGFLPADSPPEATALRSGSVGPRLQGEPASVSRIPCDSEGGRHLSSSLRSEATEVCWTRDSPEPVRKACGFSSGHRSSYHECAQVHALPRHASFRSSPSLSSSGPSVLALWSSLWRGTWVLTSALDFESNTRPFGARADTLTTEPHRPGPACAFLLLLHMFGCKAVA